MSRRNNMERTGAARNENSPAGVKTGFDFSFVAPTTFVELPSEGKFYPKDHPLHDQTTIEVREMTAHEEDILADFNLQKSGVAIDKMIQNIIVDKRINTNSLLVGDKNAITIAAQIGGYGPNYQTKVSCPACGAKSEYEFDLNSLEHKKTEVEEDVVHVGGRIFQLNLPRTDFNVQVKLLNSTEMNKYSRPLRKAMKGKGNTRLQTNFLKLVVHSVENKPDGVWYEDQPVIDQFVESIPAIDSIYIRSVYQRLTPDVDMTQNFECSECSHAQEMEVPLNAEFFWPNR